MYIAKPFTRLPKFHIVVKRRFTVVTNTFAHKPHPGVLFKTGFAQHVIDHRPGAQAAFHNIVGLYYRRIIAGYFVGPDNIFFRLINNGLLVSISDNALISG